MNGNDDEKRNGQGKAFESPKRKRRWFQFHLLTLVMLSITGGTSLYLNLIPDTYDEYGWPLIVYHPRLFTSEPIFSAVINVMAALGIIFAVGAICEWLLRYDT